VQHVHATRERDLSGLHERFQNPNDIKRFFAGLDYRPTLYKSWTGMLTVDLLHETGLGVVRVSEGGPAKTANIPSHVVFTT
jgi:hypothetical protein